MVKRLSQSEHGFTYRSSVFQQQDLIVLRLHWLFPLYRENNWLKYRGQQGSAGSVVTSCGSTFRNPPGTYAGKVIEELGLQAPDRTSPDLPLSRQLYR